MRRIHGKIENGCEDKAIKTDQLLQVPSPTWVRLLHHTWRTCIAWNPVKRSVWPTSLFRKRCWRAWSRRYWVQKARSNLMTASPYQIRMYTYRRIATH